jgi:anti-anti-sigma regulatory factor
MATQASRRIRKPTAVRTRREAGPLLSWSVTTAGPRAQLAVTGELTPVTADRLREALDWLGCAGHGQITVDLAGIDSCTAAGLDALISVLHRVAATVSGEIVLTHPSRAIRRLLGVGDDTVMQRMADQSTYQGWAPAIPAKPA